MAALRPRSPCGGGTGWGVSRTAEVAPSAGASVSSAGKRKGMARPPSRPPPQGGRRLRGHALRSRRTASYAPNEFGDDHGVGLAELFGRRGRRRALIVADESDDELRRAMIALHRAIDELLHRRHALGHASRLAVFRRLDLFVEHPIHERGETAGALRPSARIAGLAGTEAGGPIAPLLCLPSPFRALPGEGTGVRESASQARGNLNSARICAGVRSEVIGLLVPRPCPHPCPSPVGRGVC